MAGRNNPWGHNIANKIKGKVPTNAETLKMRLMNIYYSQKKNK